MEIQPAVLYFLERNNRILMLEKGIRENDPNSRMFTQPGGKIDPGETPLQAVCKESTQETGINLIDPTQVGTVLFDNTQRVFADMPAKKHFLVHVFRATEYTGQLNNGTDEGRPVWVERSRLPLLARHEGDMMLDDFVSSRRKFFGVIYHIGTKLCREKSYVIYFS